jgi:molecular chaperone GrpE
MNKDEIKYESEDDTDKADKKVKKIKEQFKHCEQERAEYLAGWQRAKADYINLEKRVNQEKFEWIKFSNAELILKLLPILDSFEVAIKHTKDKGLEQVYNQLKNTLKNEGLEEIKSIGERFNPELHEVSEVYPEQSRGTNSDKNIITEEIQKGYKLHNKVIRASKVKIGK